MKSRRQGVAIAVALALVVGRVSALHAAEAADSAAATPATPVAQGLSWSIEGTGSYHTVGRPYFGSADARDTWGEGFERVRVNSGRPDGLWFSAGGVGMATAGGDYYGAHNRIDGRLDQLEAGAANVAGSGVNVVAGRQDLVMGDGFLIGDGYVDHRAALWNIPLNFYDALRVDWKNAKWHALAFGANLSPSLGGGDIYPLGLEYGAELGLTPMAGADVTATILRQHDKHATDMNAAAYALRATWPFGTSTLTGEAVVEGGTLGGAALRGKGGHLRFVAPVKARWSPVATGEYYYFSGDDPATPRNEGYYPWQSRWSDWSQYYVGDLLASTVGTSSNMQILRAQLGVTPREGTGVRILAHRMDRNRVIAEGASKAFAYEYDLVVDQAFGPHWSAWVMGGYATPLDAAKTEWGGQNSGQVFASVSWKFSGPGDDAE